MSFDPSQMIAFRRLAPSIPRGMLADRFTAEDWPMLPRGKRVQYAAMIAAPLVMPNFVAYDVNALPAS